MGIATNKDELRTGNAERSGQEANQLAIGLAIHGGRGDRNLERPFANAHDLAPARLGLGENGEREPIVPVLHTCFEGGVHTLSLAQLEARCSPG